MLGLLKKILLGFWSIIVWYFSLSYEFMLIVAILTLVVLGWVSSWPVFESRTSRSSEPFMVSGDVIIQYQLGGTSVAGSFNVPVIKEVITTTEWFGQEVSTQCFLNVISDPDLLAYRQIIQDADRILNQNGLPFSFELTSLQSLDGQRVNCADVSITHDLYIRLSGSFERNGGNVVVTKRTGIEYEWAWILIPADLFDSVLSAAINHAGYSLLDYRPVWPPVVAAYTAKAGDPNGLVNWINGHSALLANIYKGRVDHSSASGTTDVTTSRTVVTGTRKVLDCNYKGVCGHDLVEETTTVYDTNTVETMVGNFFLVTP